MDNTEIFLQFWQRYQWPAAPKTQIRRLYHDDHGDPVIYSVEDLPGKYIDLTPQQFDARSHAVKVIDGKLIDISKGTTIKLIPSDHGVACDKRDITVISASDRNIQHWQPKNYFYNDQN